MKCRVLLRVLAIFELIVSILLFGTTMKPIYTFMKDTASLTYLQFILTFIGIMFLCVNNVFSTLVLIRATKKGTSQHYILKLCKLWEISNWISMGMISTWVIIFALARLRGHPISQFNETEKFGDWTQVFDIVFIILHLVVILNVHKFKREKKAALPKPQQRPARITHNYNYLPRILPLNNDQHSVSYVFSEECDPPPPYNMAMPSIHY